MNFDVCAIKNFGKYYYHNSNTDKKYKAKSSREASKIAKKLLSKISYYLLNSTSGVMIKGLGYLSIWESSGRINLKNFNHKFIDGYRQSLNLHTEGRLVVPEIFTSFSKDNEVRKWSIDRGASNYLKEELNKKLKSGVKYKNIYFTLKNIYNEGIRVRKRVKK